MLRAACVQMDVELGQIEANRRKIVSKIREAAQSGAELVVFPECALTGYCFDSLEEAAPFAEPLDGFSAQHIALACTETGVHAILGFIEKALPHYFNAAMVVGP